MVNSVGSCDQINGSRSTHQYAPAADNADAIEQERFPAFQQPDFYAIAVITDIAVKIYCCASCQTNGRKPTPCTLPRNAVGHRKMCFLPLSYSRHHECVTRPAGHDSVASGSHRSAICPLRILRIFPGIPLMPEQFLRFLEHQRRAAAFFCAQLFKLLRSTQISAWVGQAAIHAGPLHDGCTGRIYWLRLCQPVH